MNARAPRTEFAVGAFLLLALATLLVLAIASTNGEFGFRRPATYPLKARFSAIGQLRPNAPVKIGGVTVGNVADIQLDPVKYDAVVTLAMQQTFKGLPADTTAGIFTSGLLGESYIGLQPGGDPNLLKPGDEIAMTQPAVDLLQLVGKYMFNTAKPSGDGAGTDSSAAASPAPASPKETK